MYKVICMGKYVILLKLIKLHYKHCILRLLRIQMKGYIHPHVHMNPRRASVWA